MSRIALIIFFIFYAVSTLGLIAVLPMVLGIIALVVALTLIIEGSK